MILIITFGLLLYALASLIEEGANGKRYDRIAVFGITLTGLIISGIMFYDRDSDSVGYWVHPTTVSGKNILLHIVRERDDVYRLERVSMDKKETYFEETKLQLEQKGKQTIFIEMENPERYYVVGRNGSLIVYDHYVLVDTYNKKRWWKLLQKK